MTSTNETITRYQLDPAHTAAEFSVRHLMIANVKGRFRNVQGFIEIDETDPTRSRTEVTIAVASVDTGQLVRDNDLRSDNFFDVENYPELTFKSTRVERVSDDRWKVYGDLTIKGVTREVLLETTFDGRGKDASGKEVISFHATTRLNRREFNLNYNAVLETGGVVVGDDVRIQISAGGSRL
jgi:polyisoprenoid-binding protein YceI